MTESQSNRVALFLLLSVIATLLLYFVVPFGRLIAYPLVLLSTLAHELGHGIAAVLVGGDFEQFVMHDNGCRYDKLVQWISKGNHSRWRIGRTIRCRGVRVSFWSASRNSEKNLNGDRCCFIDRLPRLRS